MQGVGGLSDKQLARVRGRLVEFAGEMFSSMRRKDQRAWGEVYLRGLMLDGKRKSIEPMADRLADGDEQCLQQFVNQSPWDWALVRRALARRMATEIGPEGWVIDDTGFPKFGKHSVGVARQYSGSLGKVGNCQVAVRERGDRLRRLVRWTGGCSYLRSGMRTRISTGIAAGRPGWQMTSTMLRSGGSRWRCSMS